MKKKICKTCQTEKDISEFHSHKSCKYGVRPECKDCHNVLSRKRSKEYIKNNPDKRRSTILMNKYSISKDDFDLMLKNQSNSCKICRTDNPGPKGTFSVDHCHDSGKVRGLLCHSCNVGLGAFKDNEHFLSSAIEYLGGNY